jgi:hypothetical protein
MWAVLLCFRVCLRHRSLGRVSVRCWTVVPLASTAPVLSRLHSLHLIPIMWVLSHIDYCTSRVFLYMPINVLLPISGSLRFLKLSAYFIYIALLKKMDWISYVYISGTIHGMWMMYITFWREGPKCSNNTAQCWNEDETHAALQSPTQF